MYLASQEIELTTLQLNYNTVSNAEIPHFTPSHHTTVTAQNLIHLLAYIRLKTWALYLTMSLVLNSLSGSVSSSSEPSPVRHFHTPSDRGRLICLFQGCYWYLLLENKGE